MKYFYFYDRFDSEEADEAIVDGANDGGIDAIFTDPSSENNDLIIIQSKYYNNSAVSSDDVVTEIAKILYTIKSFDNHQYSHLNSRLKERFLDLSEDVQENGQIKICFFSSHKLASKKSYDTICKKAQALKNGHEINLYFHQEINEQVEYVESPNLVVEKGVLKIDETDNYLYFGSDAVVANISAHSLQDLYSKYEKKGLFNLNLRYYIKDKKVDRGIIESIKSDKSSFWYMNNGIIILCDDFVPQGRTIKLSNFSIVNGGQTTTLIGKASFAEDFYLSCKIVKTGSKDEAEKDAFIMKISSASNSQKPIKSKDLVANSAEQRLLKSKLAEIRIFYTLKRGEQVNKKIYREPYTITNPEQLGKLLLSCYLQQPGSARSNTNKIYSETVYPKLFNKFTNPIIAKDLLRIEYYYEKFKKNSKTLPNIDSQPMIMNGKYHTIAAVFLLAKVEKNIVSALGFAGIKDIPEKYKFFLETTANLEKLITSKLDNEEEIFFTLFDTITDFVLSNCYQIRKGIEEGQNNVLIPSNFLKIDKNYTEYIVPRLIHLYLKDKAIQKIVNDLFSNSNT